MGAGRVALSILPGFVLHVFAPCSRHLLYVCVVYVSKTCSHLFGASSPQNEGSRTLRSHLGVLCAENTRCLRMPCCRVRRGMQQACVCWVVGGHIVLLCKVATLVVYTAVSITRFSASLCWPLSRAATGHEQHTHVHGKLALLVVARVEIIYLACAPSPVVVPGYSLSLSLTHACMLLLCAAAHRG